MANCFWVGGTGTWDTTNTGGGGTGGIKWATASGGSTPAAGAGPNGTPGGSDAITFDANSGGGTATVSGITPTTTGSLTTSASVTGLALGSNGISVGAWVNTSGTSNINMGSGTVSLTAVSGNVFLMASSSNVTASSATISFTATGSAVRTATFGTISYGAVTFAANSSGGGWTLTGACTIGTLTVNAPNTLSFGSGTTYTISNALTITGSSGSAVALLSGTYGTAFTLALGAASTGTWCAVRDMTNTTNSFTFTNSFDLGKNTFTGGGSISAPSGGGTTVIGVIGS